MRKGHVVYLAQAVDTQTPKYDLSQVPLVCEYLDVFSKELSGLSPKRKVEFTIEVVPGTAPISQAPYRMAPNELLGIKRSVRGIARKRLHPPQYVTL